MLIGTLNFLPYPVGQGLTSFDTQVHLVIICLWLISMEKNYKIITNIIN